mmetsp:Transcript_55865/g.164068  ORF Transcript_55865/g.164068 Transcript_55865/m.164068 type:complete len:222 (-) Transcript_55865:95-760(-)
MFWGSAARFLVAVCTSSSFLLVALGVSETACAVRCRARCLLSRSAAMRDGTLAMSSRVRSISARFSSAAFAMSSRVRWISACFSSAALAARSRAVWIASAVPAAPSFTALAAAARRSCCSWAAPAAPRIIETCCSCHLLEKPARPSLRAARPLWKPRWRSSLRSSTGLTALPPAALGGIAGKTSASDVVIQPGSRSPSAELPARPPWRYGASNAASPARSR